MTFSLRQLQEKCREQKKPSCVAFVDFTKAFDLVSRDGLFKMLDRIGCPPRLLRMIQSSHEDMKSTIQYDGSTSETFDIRRGAKQGCVLAPTLFGIFFALRMRHAFGSSSEGIYLHTRSDGMFSSYTHLTASIDGKLFNLARLKAKTKVREVLVLFASHGPFFSGLPGLLFCFLVKKHCFPSVHRITRHA